MRKENVLYGKFVNYCHLDTTWRSDINPKIVDHQGHSSGLEILRNCQHFSSIAIVNSDCQEAAPDPLR